MPQKNRKEVELKKSKMMSEGGPVLSAYFNNDITNETPTNKERTAAKTMMDEGGIGAEVYYTEQQKIAKKDVSSDDAHLQ